MRTRETRALDAYHLFDREGDLRALREGFSWEVPDQFNVAEYVCDRWASSSETALFIERAVGPDEEHTFEDVARTSNRLANLLAEAGVSRGDRVAVCGSQHAEVIQGHLAAWKLGAASVPLSVLLGADGLSHRLSDAGASAIVAHGSMLEEVSAVRGELDGLETVILFGRNGDPDDGEYRGWAELESYSASRMPVDTAPDDPALINYTSGTTGEPKGVLHGHESVLGTLPTFVMSKLNMAAPDDDDVNRTIVEWSWTGAFNNTVIPSLFFGVPVLGSVGRQFDPDHELDLIERYGVTILNLPPTAIRMIRDAGLDPSERDVGTVRTIATGGESVDPGLVEWAREAFPSAVVHEVYGQTEAPTFLGDCSALGVTHREDRMGKPSIGHEVRVVDQEDPRRPVDVGTVGELALRTEEDPVCFQGYWKKPDATAEKVVDGWLLTEDLVWVDQDGYYAYFGRKDDVIISAGYRISPAEIEQCLTNHERVEQAGVVGKPHDSRGEIPKAFVVVEGGEVEDDEGLREELQTYVKDSLAKYEYPREIEFVEHIRTTTAGKVNRDALRARLSDDG